MGTNHKLVHKEHSSLDPCHTNSALSARQTCGKEANMYIEADTKIPYKWSNLRCP